MNIQIFFVFAIFSIVEVSPARILGFSVVPSISHCVVHRKLLLELSRRGHQVTIVTPSPFGISTPNYTEIDLGFTYKLFRDRFQFFAPSLPERQILEFTEFHVDLVDKELSHKPVQQLIESGKFDLVIAEMIIFPGVNALSHHFNCPFIGIASLDVPPFTHSLIGNSYNPSYHSDLFLPYNDKKDFYARVRSTILYMFWMMVYYWYMIPKHDALAKKHFGPDTPHILDIEKNVSMIFTYTDIASAVPIPTVPGYVRFGGGKPLHMPEKKPLPQGCRCKDCHLRCFITVEEYHKYCDYDLKNYLNLKNISFPSYHFTK